MISVAGTMMHRKDDNELSTDEEELDGDDKDKVISDKVVISFYLHFFFFHWADSLNLSNISVFPLCCWGIVTFYFY